MDSHKTAGGGPVYVPNEYTVFLSTRDRGQARGIRALARAGAVRLPPRARAAARLRPLTRPRSSSRPMSDCASASSGSRRVWSSRRPVRARRRPRARRATRWSTRRSRSAAPEEAGGPAGGRCDPRSRRPRRPALRPRGAAGDDRPLEGRRVRAARPERLPPPRRAPALAQRRLDDRRPRLDQRDQGQRQARRARPGSARATR